MKHKLKNKDQLAVQQMHKFKLEKIKSAEIFERVLSQNLAIKFITSWQTMKIQKSKISRSYMFDSIKLKQLDHSSMQRSNSALYDFSSRKYQTKNALLNQPKRRKRQQQLKQKKIITSRSIDQYRMQLSRGQILEKIQKKLRLGTKIKDKITKRNQIIDLRVNKIQKELNKIKKPQSIGKAVKSRIFMENDKDLIKLKILSQINDIKNMVQEIKSQNSVLIQSRSQSRQKFDWVDKSRQSHTRNKSYNQLFMQIGDNYDKQKQARRCQLCHRSCKCQ